MSAIRRFFEKKKMDTKFKQAGSGHKLTEDRMERSTPSTTKLTQHQQQSSSAARAGEAAIARLDRLQQNQKKKPASSNATWKNKGDTDQVRRDLQENTLSPSASISPRVVKDHSLAVDGVFFTCPVYPACLPLTELYTHVHDALLNDLQEEPLMISVTMIHTLNRDKGKLAACINILKKYLQNIIDHPGEEKYCKIRKGNKVFQEKVKPTIGVDEFLTKGCGFETQELPIKDESDEKEEFYVLNEQLAANIEQLVAASEMLSQAEALDIVLDRNLKVLAPSDTASKMRVPESFYQLSTDEIKREQVEKTELAEKSKQLRTKEMREADTSKKQFYKFTLIRIRLPDGILLQGTFRSSEKLLDVKEFIKQQLALDWLPFDLLDTIGKPLREENATLNSLKLEPTALLNFHLDSTVTSEIASSSADGKIRFLKEEILLLVSDANS